MSKLYVFREFISEILSTAALEIFGGVEKTLIEYKEEISRSEEERKRLQRLLNVVTQPNIAEVQQLSLPEPRQIKEEQELWTSQEEEQLQGLQSETTDSIFTSLSVKHDSDQDGSVECSHLDQAVQVDNREGDSLHTNTTEEQIKVDPEEHNYAAPQPGSDSQPLSVVAPDCPAAQSLEEEEHGGVMPLLETVKSSRKRKNMTLPMEGTPQGSHAGDKPYQCQECNKTFSWKSRFVVHMRTHTGEKPYQCLECTKTFSWKSHLVVHMRTHTGEKPYQCLECKKSFTLKQTLLNHMTIHTGEKLYQCPHCGKKFVQKGSLVLHMKRHTGEKPYKCQHCSKQFFQKGNLVAHMRIHTGEKPFQCQECYNTFSRKDSLVLHMRTHTGVKPYQCQECSKRFICKVNMVTHLRTHYAGKSYQCLECNQRFRLKYNFVEHMRTHKGEEQELWTSQEEEKLQGLQSQTTDSIFTSLSVKHDSDQEGSVECSHFDQAVQVDNREGDSLPSNTTEEQIKADPEEHNYAAPEPGSDFQPLSVVAADCPAATSTAQSLEKEEHGGVMPLLETVKSSRKRKNKNMTLPMEGTPQGSHTGEKPYQCLECNNVFSHKATLSVHMRTHTGEKLFQCPHCSKRFPSKANLVEHMRTHTEQKTFTFNGYLANHIRTHTGEEQEMWTSQEEEQLQGLKSETTDPILTSLSVKHDCDQESSSECSHLDQTVKVENREGDSLPSNTTEEQIKAEPDEQDSAAPEPGSDSQPLSVVAADCPAAQSLEEEGHGGVMPLLETVKSSRKIKKKNMNLPMENTPQGSHTGEKPYQCLECNTTFSWKSRFLVHMRTHTGEKPYQCLECNRTFNWNSHFLVHMRTHTREKPYQCLECKKSFTFKRSLLHHMIIHTGEKPFQCPECNKAFGPKAALVVHMRTHTGEKPFQCPHCSKHFASRGSVVKHMRTHTGEKPFQCQQCNKRFAQKVSLVCHMRTHTGEKPFQCQQCNKQFSQKCNFVSHMRKHTGHKPFQCQQCNITFSKKGTLTRHLRKHPRKKPHKCQECNKTFRLRNQLYHHERTHNVHIRHKPYCCQHCSRGFGSNSALVVHMRMHTGEKPFQCPHCNQTFSQKGNLTTHMRKHKGEMHIDVRYVRTFS
ncbi:zinc finger protein 84-like isoform X2 [Osmerus eperlanus]|uniref:zinc finger protein 84-like isoform X2 n=1 Tax=Osmerus eperlanus TaxID=29151 RepID=UPI002E0FEAB4